ncbi:Vps52 / Sac2 family protein [Cryptosporidium muris RN66]|uniref:Vps52 / Sac2 family protein n=1 Tax=Cryptosporidium muris (strain RN66) TaxID=441375 RepID=B6AD47_CRYMR|nr:Vps52 / Sac2 family protein [Cryptosporidium muris RN66]EEA06051.1 Vps52 / Sac2 family protein [Cryptosporidium muris RN66]|eukprot:XP_002140400.1 Vps52 / Sac2 family protein [Cryptosporidium muris RN66]
MERVERILFSSDSIEFLYNYKSVKDEEVINFTLNVQDTTQATVDKLESLNCVRNIIKNILCNWKSARQLCESSNQLMEYLESVETSLLKVKSNISEFTVKVDDVKIRFDELQDTVKNLKQLYELISVYINQILITPDIIEKILKGNIDEYFISLVEDIEKRFERANHEGLRSEPSVQDALPIIKSTLNISRQRIYNNLYNILVESTKKPIEGCRFLKVLNNKLLAKEKMNKYLRQSKLDMSNIKIIYCKNICDSVLSKVLEDFVKLINLKKKGMDEPITYKDYDKTKCSLTERDEILYTAYVNDENSYQEEDLKSNNLRNQYFVEEIYYKTHKVLCNIFLEEYEFCKRFFQEPLNEILLQIFSQYLDKFIYFIENNLFKNCNDVMGILLANCIRVKATSYILEKIDDTNKDSDKNIILKYFNKQSSLFLNVFEKAMIFHINSLSTFSNKDFLQSTSGSQQYYPHFIPRRVAELVYLTSKLADKCCSDIEKQFISRVLSRLQQAIAIWLKSIGSIITASEEFSQVEVNCIFVVNNVDLIFSIIQDGTFLDIFQHIFREYSQKYIDYRLQYYYPQLNRYTTNETLEISICESKILRENFYKSWASNLDYEFHLIVQSFSNFSTVEEIIRLFGTTLATRYSNFLNCMSKYDQDEDINKYKVDPDLILEHIQKCLYPQL